MQPLRHPIERRRHAAGLRQADLAERLGVSTLSVRNWEAGREPRGPRIAKIAAVLGVDPLSLRDELDQWAATHVSGTPARPRRRRRVDVFPA